MPTDAELIDRLAFDLAIATGKPYRTILIQYGIQESSVTCIRCRMQGCAYQCSSPVNKPAA